SASSFVPRCGTSSGLGTNGASSLVLRPGLRTDIGPWTTDGPRTKHHGLIPKRLVGQFDAQERRLIFVRDEVHQPVRALTDVAHALMEFAQQRLAAHLFPFVVEHDSLNLSAARDLAFAHAADEHVALPAGKLVARVERQT